MCRDVVNRIRVRVRIRDRQYPNELNKTTTLTKQLNYNIQYTI